MEDVVTWSASAMARAVRTRELSSLEIVEAHLRRIDAVEPMINAIVHLAADQALEAARAADAALGRGELAGPLHGVPVTIKDNLDVAGMPCTGGTLGRASSIPAEDATVVARLRAAGAVIVAKTNLPELALAYETDSPVGGRTNNPYDLARTPGGSTGGEAALIAAGGSPLGLGNDMAGSIRVPAHFCGIAGIKPTTGRVPLTGHFLPISGALTPYWQHGPMARRVEDLAMALPLIAGPDGRDPRATPAPLGDPAVVDARGLRVAVHVDNGVAPPTAETAEAVIRAAAALADAGATVVDARPPALEEANWLHGELFQAAIGIERLLAQAGTTSDQIHPLLRHLLTVMRRPTMDEFLDALERWDTCRRTLLAFMADHHAILSPACATPAPHHGDTFAQIPAFSYPRVYNLLGWPAAVVRAGTSPEGLPIGMQIVAAPWREDIVLALAARIEDATGGWEPPPL